MHIKRRYKSKKKVHIERDNKIELESYLILKEGGLVFATTLVGTLGITAWVVPLPLGSSLVVKGRVTNTNSWLWETPFSSEVSLGEVGSLVGLRATSIAVSFSFSIAPTWSTSLGGMVEGGRVLAEVFFLRSVSLGALSALELEGLDA